MRPDRNVYGRGPAAVLRTRPQARGFLFNRLRRKVPARPDPTARAVFDRDPRQAAP